MKTKQWVAAALCFALLGCTQDELMTAEDVIAMPSPPPDHRITYADGPLQFGNLRLPSGPGPHPVAIVVHGGCWLGAFDIGHIGPLAQAFADAGIAAWSLEYRRVGNPGGGWPGTFQDVARGADYLREIAAEHNLDLDRVIAIGLWL